MKCKTWTLIGASLFLLPLFVFPSMAISAPEAYINPPEAVHLMDDAGKKVGTVPIGTPIEVLNKNPSIGQMKIRTSKGKEGWVYASNVSPEIPTSEILKKTQDQLGDIQKQFTQLESEKSALSNQLETLLPLQEAHEKLLEKNQMLENELNRLKKALPNHPILLLTQPEHRKTFILGASVLLAGLILGFILSKMSSRPKGIWQYR